SEYIDQHSVSKMIGSPPGYVGYEEGGQLSEKVRRNPYSVILFDEIEKAHIDVFNVLLQILDDGHVTDSQGRKVDFKNTIIIMTSNAGAQNIVSPKKLGFASKEDSEKNYQDMKNQVMEEVKHIFKPEFLNRIDDIIVFHALEKEDMKQIAQIMLGKIIDRAEKQFEMKLKFTPAAKEFLIEAGSDKVYGARPLRRAIQTHIEDSLADEILFGRVKKGDTVTVGVKDKKIYFSVK
ncbi:MAG: AAA family ATPase, partial [Lachnospiraceae bacterium]|nr:AAA family ATPase [Lachnospiraceae bacterium]